MRTLILYVLLSVICCSFLSYNKRSVDDFGLYCEINSKNITEIVIRATYFVTAGIRQDSLAAAQGISFWHRLNGDFYLRVDSSDTAGQLIYPIRFDLKLVVTQDPERKKRSTDTLAYNHIDSARPSNTFYIVDQLDKCSQGETHIDPDKSDGLTCGDYQIRIRRQHAGNYFVAAHEIGHTLGLPDTADFGLMHGYNYGYSNVYESYIRAILDYSWQRRGNWFRNHYNFCIPQGKIFHKDRRRPKGPDTNTEFKTDGL